MSDKLKSRIAVSNGHPTSVNPRILPPELGGSGESYAQLAKHWKDYAQQHAAWFVADDEFKSKLAQEPLLGSVTTDEEGTEEATEA